MNGWFCVKENLDYETWPGLSIGAGAWGHKLWMKAVAFWTNSPRQISIVLSFCFRHSFKVSWTKTFIVKKANTFKVRRSFPQIAADTLWMCVCACELSHAKDHCSFHWESISLQGLFERLAETSRRQKGKCGCSQQVDVLFYGQTTITKTAKSYLKSKETLGASQKRAIIEQNIARSHWFSIVYYALCPENSHPTKIKVGFLVRHHYHCEKTAFAMRLHILCFFLKTRLELIFVQT